MTRADAPAAARLHLAQLPHGFFPQLGRPFLAEYYRAFIASPYAVALVADDGRGVAGVLAGVVDGRHNQWVVSNRGVRLGAVAVLSLVLRPWLVGPFVARRLRRYARAVYRVRRRTPEPEGAPPPRAALAVLSHIVVAESARGLGVGTSLADEFVRVARRHGAEMVRTTTLEGAAGAVEFYRRMGWAISTRATDWDGNRIVVLTRATS